MIRWKVKKFIEDNHLFNRKDTVLAGVSGGADSVAMLRMLLQMGFKVEAAHCNFKLRGEESEHDTRFVQDLCNRLKIKLHVNYFNTEEYASSHKISIEMAARELRYAWFDQLLETRKLSVIAVAHHLEDNAETVLMNLIRGTGLTGLCGMKPVNRRIVRPLLNVSREEIEAYLAQLNQPFVTDSTNLEDNCVRNKIRLNLLPEMKTINPSVVTSIVQTAGRLNDARLMLEKEINEAVQRCKLKADTAAGLSGGCRINIHQLQFETSPRLLLYRILSPYGFNSSQLDEIYASLSGESGRLFESPKGWVLLRDRNFLLVQESRPEEELNTTERTCLYQASSPDRTQKIQTGQACFQIETQPVTREFIIPHQRNYACLDAGKVSGNLYLRRWKQGDRFIPFGMKGSKLVSDYMTDNKFSLFKKQEQTVVVDEHDRIVWLTGERIDDRYKVDAYTQQIILIHCTHTH